MSYNFNAEFMKQRHNCIDNYVKTFDFEEKNIEKLQKERKSIEKDFIPFFPDLDNNKLFNNYFESRKQYFMSKKQTSLNSGFSKNMWFDDFGKAFGTYNFYGVENVPKVEFMESVKPMFRSEAIEKIRKHYNCAKEYGIELDRKTLPSSVIVDYKMLEIFSSTNCQ